MSEVQTWPQTVEEAVELLWTGLPPSARQEIAEKPSADDFALSEHFNMGMWIRNKFGLWEGNKALMQSVAGNTPHPHPDGVSHIILKALYERAQRVTK